MKRYEALDSWRGVAACMVALYHVKNVNGAIPGALVDNAWMFVDFFFVLSGFVIAANYGRRLQEGFGLGRFMWLRFGRLYPLHLAMLLAFVAALVLGVHTGKPRGESFEAALANVALVQGLHLFDFLTWNYPSWSISVEFFTYFMFAGALVVLGQWLRGALVAVVVLAPVFLYFAAGSLDVTFDYGLIRCLFGFSAGVLTYELHRKMPARWAGSGLELAALLAVVLIVSMAGTSGVSLAAPAVFAGAVLVFAEESGAVSALLKRAPFLALGTLSYSIYMVHALVADALRDARGASTLLDGALFKPVYLAIVIAVSALTYRLIEAPGRAWTRSIARSRPMREFGLRPRSS